MPRRIPLSAKILLLFLLNLALLAVMFLVLFLAQFRAGQDWILSSDACDRIEAESDIILGELAQQPRAQWSETLHRFDGAYRDKVRFLAFDGRGEQLAGEPIVLPEEIRRRIMGPHGPPPGPGPGERPPPDEGPGNRHFDEAHEEGVFGHPHDPRPKFLNHTKNPSRYWVVVRAMFPDPNRGRPAPLNLILVSDNLAAGGLFFTLWPWITIALAAVALSAVLWFPLLRGINRSIAQMTQATRQIAEGRFETRVAENRRDELGELGRSVNQMAARLAGLVAGQKRFLGDVAHELCSPLAKLRVSLGILDQRAGEKHKDYIARAEDEAAHIAGLVNELLSFSKASLTAPNAVLRPVNILQTVEKAVHREAAGQSQLHVEVPAEFVVKADAELLTRALSNLLRNAVRYAGEAGPITVRAQRDQNEVKITVADHGPGVPPGDLTRLFDPFYRADASRDRQTGGVGLGLAIVKTCVESCGGTVSCRNLQPAGLEVAILLQAETQV
jgi:two-component system, OmpR family, sensor histidine kinase CpxA